MINGRSARFPFLFIIHHSSFIITMSLRYTTSELEAYLEEALSPEEMATIEKAIRAKPELARQLSEINGRRDAGLHTLGEIWRRHRVSCPTREQLGSHLLGVLSAE